MDKLGTYKVAAVIVTYNRLRLLKQCIDSIKNQTRGVDEIIVVNNSSTDGTLEWLKTQRGITIITQENSGSAGGEYTGIKNAFQKKYDWVWCLDQDIIPYHDALEKLLNTDESNMDSIGFLSSLVLDNDGNISYINVPYTKNFEVVLEALTKNKNLPIISSSFGSVLFSNKAIGTVGFPNRDFFIWGDDVEYTMRMIQNNFKGFLVLSSKTIHNQEENLYNPFPYMDIKNKKTKYAIRNTFIVIRWRNKLLYNSTVRGILGCLNFFHVLVKGRTKYKGSFDVAHFLFLTYNLLAGLLYPLDKEERE